MAGERHSQFAAGDLKKRGLNRSSLSNFWSGEGNTGEKFHANVLIISRFHDFKSSLFPSRVTHSTVESFRCFSVLRIPLLASNSLYPSGPHMYRGYSDENGEWDALTTTTTGIRCTRLVESFIQLDWDVSEIRKTNAARQSGLSDKNTTRMNTFNFG